MHTTRTPRTAAIVLLGLFTFASMGPAVAARSRPGPGELALTSSAKKPDTEAAKRVRTAYAGMPLRFERAAGAAAAKAEFIARGAGYALDLSKGEARLVIGGTADGPRSAVTMRLLGASAAAEGGVRRLLPGLTNYLIGHDPREWRTGVRSYAEVEYRDVYPGVNVVYYGNQRQLEFDFIVAPARAIARLHSALMDQHTFRSIAPETCLWAPAPGPSCSTRPRYRESRQAPHERWAAGMCFGVTGASASMSARTIRSCR